MLARPFFQRLVQLFQQLALVLCELHWRFNRDVAIQVARVTGADALDAFAAQAELLGGLRALGNVDRRLAGQRRHFDFAAQRCGRETDGYRAVQVVAIALEDVVLFQTDLDVQVTGRAAVGAWLAVTR